jgi:hypothetical protein
MKYRNDKIWSTRMSVTTEWVFFYMIPKFSPFIPNSHILFNIKSKNLINFKSSEQQIVLLQINIPWTWLLMLVRKGFLKLDGKWHSYPLKLFYRQNFHFVNLHTKTLFLFENIVFSMEKSNTVVTIWTWNIVMLCHIRFFKLLLKESNRKEILSLPLFLHKNLPLFGFFFTWYQNSHPLYLILTFFLI